MEMDAEKLILKLFKTFSLEATRKRPLVAYHHVQQRTCHALGISKHCLDRLLKKEDTEENSMAETSGAVTKSRSAMGLPDSFDTNIIHRTTLSMLSANKTVTLKNLKDHVVEAGIQISKYTLWKTLHKLGFHYGRPDTDNKQTLIERCDLAMKRCTFLRKIREFWQQQKPVFDLDETWVDTHTYPAKQWVAPEGQQGRKLPISRGQRFVVLHCGSQETGFVEGCDLVFLSKANDGRDYHSEMNGRIFENWVKDQLTPALPSHSVVVMDNASYHSVQVEGSKAPTSATRKQEMVNWLEEKGISVDPTLKKPQVYELIKAHKGQMTPTYSVDAFLAAKGHHVLRLPPYHCELNPIELIWGELKQFIAASNHTFKQQDVRELINRGFQKITKESWRKACQHVLKIEEEWWKRDNIQAKTVQPVVIHISDDDDDDTDNDDE